MSRQNGPANPLPPALYVVGAAVAVLVVGLAAVLLLGSGNSRSSGAPQAEQTTADTAGSGTGGMPDYVMSAPEDVQMAYQFAMDRPDIMMWMPCYCGCGGHAGHKSAKNCFIKESSTATNIQFDEHGAGCQMCVTIALDTKAMTEEGRSLKEVRTYIDDKFGDIGPGTDTPMPPG
ncbi:MAG: PCYCGC motif-containing (lipo)protein [Dehalococcoidia bacterium]|nr:PCYCGC motif-containing (lipo)protein [Dehalococcoidia bacterium]